MAKKSGVDSIYESSGIKRRKTGRIGPPAPGQGVITGGGRTMMEQDAPALAASHASTYGTTNPSRFGEGSIWNRTPATPAVAPTPAAAAQAATPQPAPQPAPLPKMGPLNKIDNPLDLIKMPGRDVAQNARTLVDNLQNMFRYMQSQPAQMPAQPAVAGPAGVQGAVTPQLAPSVGTIGPDGQPIQQAQPAPAQPGQLPTPEKGTAGQATIDPSNIMGSGGVAPQVDVSGPVTPPQRVEWPQGLEGSRLGQQWEERATAVRSQPGKLAALAEEFAATHGIDKLDQKINSKSRLFQVIKEYERQYLADKNPDILAIAENITGISETTKTMDANQRKFETRKRAKDAEQARVEAKTKAEETKQSGRLEDMIAGIQKSSLDDKAKSDKIGSLMGKFKAKFGGEAFGDKATAAQAEADASGKYYTAPKGAAAKDAMSELGSTTLGKLDAGVAALSYGVAKKTAEMTPEEEGQFKGDKKPVWKIPPKETYEELAEGFETFRKRTAKFIESQTHGKANEAKRKRILAVADEIAAARWGQVLADNSPELFDVWKAGYDAEQAKAGPTGTRPQPTPPNTGPVPAQPAGSGPRAYGNREDGTPKGPGFLGELPGLGGDQTGKVMTELSIGMSWVDSVGEFNGELPLMVPGLTPEELSHIQHGKMNAEGLGKTAIDKSIIKKAVAHAQMRREQGKSVYIEEGEPPTITDEAAYNKLQPGTIYIDARDGKPKRKT